MRQRLTWTSGALVSLIIILFSHTADAVIKVDTPLAVLERDSTYIVVGTVEKFFPEKPALLVTVTEDIKGKTPFRQIPINCKMADENAAKKALVEPLMKRLGPDLEIIFFIYKPRGGADLTTYKTFAFANGTWFQITGTQVGEKEKVVFSLTSAEPYFRKSFHGTTDELRKLLKDHAAKKGTLPALDKKIEPGLGPEYQPKRKSELPRFLKLCFTHDRPPAFAGQGMLFGVIAPVIGGPLAILAMLFPTVFGGAFGLFRQWLALISLLSLSSTVFLLRWWLGEAQMLPRGAWWTSDPALWLFLLLATLVFTLWAWRRQLNYLYSGETETSDRMERLFLLGLSGACILIMVLTSYFGEIKWSDVGWLMTVVMSAGVFAGAIYKFYHGHKRRALFASPPLATEGVILGAMLVADLAFVPVLMGGSINTGGTASVGDQVEKTEVKLAPVVKKWDFTADGYGMFASSPLVYDDVVYAAYSESTHSATLLCLDRHTSAKKWEFIGAKNDLVQMISTPCLAAGKLYFGEGFHDDPNCKVYCVDAKTGREIWRFVTAGQTESSPTVANGKVYIGAGNDGVYCLDATTGAKIWRYPGDDYKGRLLRFGGGMCVAGNRLYCGTGVDRNQKDDKGETATLCLDAVTGKLIWKTVAPFPIWSTPVVKVDTVYIAPGNGDVMEDAKAPEKPGGALQALDVATGQQKWIFKVENGIMESPAIDAHRLYFGCRDGYVYCLGRFDGKERWRRFLESPIVGTPALDSDQALERTTSVFAASDCGKVCCLNPQTGSIVWTFALANACVTTAPRLVVSPTPEGYRRQLYFGAGVGGGIREFAANRPVFYCLEDTLKVE